jgi:hypothetical protein
LRYDNGLTDVKQKFYPRDVFSLQQDLISTGHN